MTREENLLYRRQCPYDAMGDYSVLMENEKNIKAERNAKKSDAGIRQKIQPIAIEEGLRFAIREGGRTVGSGVVTAINE